MFQPHAGCQICLITTQLIVHSMLIVLSLANAAGFVCASAIGMALGPFLALPLGQMPTIRAGLLTFDYITTAGWIMIVAWVAFIALWVTTFKDPLKE